jgi:hypothetical protein
MYNIKFTIAVDVNGNSIGMKFQTNGFIAFGNFSDGEELNRA